MTRKVVTLMGVLILGLLLIASSCAPAAEKVKPAEFYTGKTIDFTVTDKPGGTPDFVARLIAPYLKQHTGATVMVSNRRGGGGLEGIVYVNHAQPDGLTLGMGTLLPLVLNKVMGEPGADYEPEKFSYIMGVCSEPMIFCVAIKGAYNSIADLKAGKNIKLGGTSPAGNISLGGMSAIHILDLDAKLVAGSKGTSPLMLSIQQEEVAGAALTLGTTLRGIKGGNVKPLFVLGTKRLAVLPDVPAVTELVQLTGNQKKMVELWDKLRQTRVLFTTPGVPKDRITFLEEIISKNVITDSAFRAKVDKKVRYKNEDYISGEEVAKVVKALMKDAKEIRETFQGLIERYRA